MLLEKWKNSVDKGKCFRSLLIDVNPLIITIIIIMIVIIIIINNNNNNNDNNNNKTVYNRTV